jgi:hypothetical protein
MPAQSSYAAVSGDKTALGRWSDRWYLTCLALVMIAVAIAGFAPSIVNTSRRLAPITLLVAAHGVLFFLWLLLFLLQTSLIATRHNGLHRRMGVVAVVLLTALVPLSYVVTVQMVRRGFDLSGDQMARTDPLFGSIFNFVGLIEFTLLAGAALAFRRRKEIHKRLILFANITLIEVSITHLLGHFGLLSPPAVVAGTAMFLLSVVAWDYLRSRRVRPLTALVAVSIFLLLPIQGVLGTTAAWHHFAARITRY